MGNQNQPQKDITLTDQSLSNWAKLQNQGSCELWLNKLNNRRYQAYPIPDSYARSSEQLQKYAFRKSHSAHLVATEGVLNNDSTMYCTEPKSAYVVLENIPYRLGQYPRTFAFGQQLYILENAASGYNILNSFFGPLQPTNNTICFSDNGRVKVWLNENLAINEPAALNRDLGNLQQVRSRTRLCVQKLIQLVSNAGISSYPPQFALEASHLESYFDLNNFVSYYKAQKGFLDTDNIEASVLAKLQNKPQTHHLLQNATIFTPPLVPSVQHPHAVAPINHGMATRSNNFVDSGVGSNFRTSHVRNIVVKSRSKDKIILPPTQRVPFESHYINHVQLEAPSVSASLPNIQLYPNSHIPYASIHPGNHPITIPINQSNPGTPKISFKIKKDAIITQPSQLNQTNGGTYIQRSMPTSPNNSNFKIIVPAAQHSMALVRPNQSNLASPKKGEVIEIKRSSPIKMVQQQTKTVVENQLKEVFTAPSLVETVFVGKQSLEKSKEPEQSEPNIVIFKPSHEQTTQKQIEENKEEERIKQQQVDQEVNHNTYISNEYNIESQYEQYKRQKQVQYQRRQSSDLPKKPTSNQAQHQPEFYDSSCYSFTEKYEAPQETKVLKKQQPIPEEQSPAHEKKVTTSQIDEWESKLNTFTLNKQSKGSVQKSEKMVNSYKELESKELFSKNQEESERQIDYDDIEGYIRRKYQQYLSEPSSEGNIHSVKQVSIKGYKSPDEEHYRSHKQITHTDKGYEFNYKFGSFGDKYGEKHKFEDYNQEHNSGYFGKETENYPRLNYETETYHYEKENKPTLYNYYPQTQSNHHYTYKAQYASYPSYEPEIPAKRQSKRTSKKFQTNLNIDEKYKKYVVNHKSPKPSNYQSPQFSPTPNLNLSKDFSAILPPDLSKVTIKSKMEYPPRSQSEFRKSRASNDYKVSHVEEVRQSKGFNGFGTSTVTYEKLRNFLWEE